MGPGRVRQGPGRAGHSRLPLPLPSQGCGAGSRARSRQRGAACAAGAGGRGTQSAKGSHRAARAPRSQRGRACDICPVSSRHGRAGPGLADRCRIQETLAVMWTKARPQRPRWKAETGTSGVRFCRVREKVEDMEILINTHEAGFAQGSTGCHGAGGPQPQLTGRPGARSPVGRDAQAPPGTPPCRAGWGVQQT